jgi:hypothetical protein
MAMYYIIITLFLYFNSLAPSQKPKEQVELPQLTFSEIKNGFFEEIKKSKFKKLGLSLRTGILSLGVTQLLSKKYSMFKKHGKKIATLFFLLPLSSQAAAYYYFGKHPTLRTFQNNTLFHEQYNDVLTKRQEKSQTEVERKPEIKNENEEKLQDLIKKVKAKDLNFENPQPNIIEITDILLSVLDKKTLFKKYAHLLKEKLNSLDKDYNNFNNNNISDKKSNHDYERAYIFIAIEQIKNNDLKSLFNRYFTNTELNKKEMEDLEHTASKLIPTIKTTIEAERLYKLKLPPLPDEGIAGNEEKPIKQKEDNEETVLKTDDYFDFNIKNLELNESFSNNLSILVFYILEINNEKKLEHYAIKLIKKTIALMETHDIAQDAIQEHINEFFLKDMIPLFGQYHQAYKEEKLTKFFIFRFVKNIEKEISLQLMNEFITKNLRSNRAFSDIIKENTLQFIKNNNISPETIKRDYLKNKEEQAKKKYEDLLNKDRWDWLFLNEN